MPGMHKVPNRGMDGDDGMEQGFDGDTRHATAVHTFLEGSHGAEGWSILLTVRSHEDGGGRDQRQLNKIAITASRRRVEPTDGTDSTTTVDLTSSPQQQRLAQPPIYIDITHLRRGDAWDEHCYFCGYIFLFALIIFNLLVVLALWLQYQQARVCWTLGHGTKGVTETCVLLYYDATRPDFVTQQ
eukprot:1219801-Rhodomonas_salina.2